MTKSKDDIAERIAELQGERQRLDAELSNARAEARDNLIAGKKPGNLFTVIAERIGVLDEALAELQERQGAANASAERNNRKRRAETALDVSAKRTKLAASVDDALTNLASSCEAYADALRKDVGAVSGAGGDVTAVERALTNNRAAEPLVKALIQAGGVKLARSLGIDTPIRERHASTLADAEDRVARSLQVELLRIKASSPQPNVSREAQRELKELES